MTNPMTKRLLSVLTLMLAATGIASASGFQLREQSASSEGNAFAGASAGDQDLSSMFWNPAVLPLFGGTQVSLGGSWIGVHMDLSNATSTRAPGFQPGQQTISGAANLPNAVNQPILPTLYMVTAVNDRVSLGLSVNVPFGLVTKYPDSFLGRYYGIETNLKVYDISPSIGFKAGSDWTLGVAFVARKTQATISNGVDFGAIGNSLGVPGMTPGGADAIATLTGNAWSYGYKAGFTWQPSSTFRLGVGYQSAANVNVKGQIAYSSVPALFQGTFLNGAADATLNLPATASGGFTWTLTPAFSLQAEAAWTGWSVFKTLAVTFPAPSSQPPDVTNEAWVNTWFGSLGGLLKVSPEWTLKAGLAYDRSPVDDAHRTPRVPDADRTWVTLGAGWNASKNTTVDFAVARLFCPTVTMGLMSGNVPTGPNYYRGNLTGSYSVGATIVALSARYKF